MCQSGVVLCAIAVAVFKLAALGVDPYQTMMAGLDNWLPIPFGTIHTIVSVVFLVFALLTDRKTIGLACKMIHCQIGQGDYHIPYI